MAHKDNDEWIDAAVEYQSEALTRFLLGQSLTPWQQRLIDVFRASVGVPPEGPMAFTKRMRADLAEGSPSCG